MNSFRPYSPNSLSGDRQRLEQLWQAPSTDRPSDRTIARWMKHLGQQLLAFLTDSQQLRIWTQESKAGTLWHVYDPVTNETVTRDSEAELRVWLEQRR